MSLLFRILKRRALERLADADVFVGQMPGESLPITTHRCQPCACRGQGFPATQAEQAPITDLTVPDRVWG